MYEQSAVVSIKVVSKAIEAIGRTVAWVIYVMAVLMVVIVVLRYVFHTSIIIQQELVEYMHALLFMFGLSYTLKHDAHVRVDLFYNNLTERKKTWINLGGHVLLLLPVVCIVGYFSIDFALNSWAIFEQSDEVRGLPFVYLLKSIIPISFGLILIQSIVEIYYGINWLRKERG